MMRQTRFIRQAQEVLAAVCHPERSEGPSATARQFPFTRFFAALRMTGIVLRSFAMMRQDRFTEQAQEVLAAMKMQVRE